MDKEAEERHLTTV